GGARRRKEYVGPWVPEPVDTRDGARDSALAESLAQAFLLMLERLSPDERAAFLLRTVFDYGYAEIAEVLGKSEVHVRQIVSRARHRLGQDAPRVRPPPHEAGGVAGGVAASGRAGAGSVEEMLTEDVEVLSDGAGKVSAARTVITGRDRAARFLAGVFSKKRRDCAMHATTVNGEPGVVFASGGAVLHVVSLRIEGGVR